MESKAQTILAARTNNPRAARIVQDERFKNHTERLALKILAAMEDPAAYHVIRMGDLGTGDERLRLGISINTTHTDEQQLRGALQALQQGFETVERGLENRNLDSQSIHSMLNAGRGTHEIFFVFNDLDKKQDMDTAIDYLKDNRSDITKAVRSAIFGQVGRYVQ